MCTSWGSTRPSTRSCMAAISTISIDQVMNWPRVEKGLGILVDEKLNISWQCALTVQEANFILGCIEGSVATRSGEMILSLHCALMRPHPGHWSAVFRSVSPATDRTWAVQAYPGHKNNGLKHLSYEERLGMWMLQMGSQGKSHV